MSDVRVYVSESGHKSHRVVPPIQTPPSALVAMERVHMAALRHACNCESFECSHPYMGVPASANFRAFWVGAICTACAMTHMRPYLVH